MREDKRFLAGIVIITLMVLSVLVNAAVKPRPSPLTGLIKRFVPFRGDFKGMMEGKVILHKNIIGEVRELRISARSSPVTVEVGIGRTTSVIARSKELGGEARAFLSNGVLTISAKNCGVLIRVNPDHLRKVEITADSSFFVVKLNNLSSDLEVTADSSAVSLHVQYSSGNSTVKLNADNSFISGRIYVPTEAVAVDASASNSMVKVTTPSGELTLTGGGSRSLGTASPGAFLLDVTSRNSMVSLELLKVSP